MIKIYIFQISDYYHQIIKYGFSRLKYYILINTIYYFTEFIFKNNVLFYKDQIFLSFSLLCVGILSFYEIYVTYYDLMRSTDSYEIHNLEGVLFYFIICLLIFDFNNLILCITTKVL